MKTRLLHAAVFLALSSIASANDDAEIRDALDTALKENETTAAIDANVKVRDGVVTFTGTAENLPAKSLASEVAGTVYGVRSIVNRLEVREIDRDDETIKYDLDRLYSLKYPTEQKAIDYKVNDGVVTLTGAVSSYDVSQLAERMASSIYGVRSVINLLRVEPLTPANDDEIRQHLSLRLRSDPWVDSDLVMFSVKDGVVTMKGAVDSLSERSRLIRLAQVYGVRSLNAEDLEVSPELRPKMSRPHRAIFRSDEEIKSSLSDAFRRDPRIAHSKVEIEVLDGDITLTGAVNSIGAKAAAEEDARNVPGASLVYSFLSVAPDSEVEDEALSKALDAIFQADALLQGAGLEPKVSDGVVELHGRVLNTYQRRRAITTAANAIGVKKVVSKMRVDWDSDESDASD